jgi:protein O-GlcNAc transferase
MSTRKISTSVTSNSVSREISALFSAGLSHHQNGEFQQAKVIYGKLLKIQPRHFDALHFLGAIAIEMRDYSGALEFIDDAIKVNNSSAEAHTNHGFVLHALKQYQNAVDSFKQAIAIKPDFLQAHFNRGNSLHELKQYQNAIDSFEKAIAIKADYAQAYFNRGNALHELKQYQNAIDSFEKAIAIKADYAQAYVNKGNSQQELQQHQNAIRSFALAIAINPDYPEAYSNRGNALSSLKKHQSAVDSCDKAIAIKPDYAQAYFNRGNALNALQQYQNAVESYDKAIALKPDYAGAYCNRGNSFWFLKDYQSASDSYDKSIAIRPDHAQAYYNRGVTLSDLKNYQSAINYFDQAMALKPDLEFIRGTRLHAKMKICDWSNLNTELGELIQDVENNALVATSFSVLALCDDLPLQKKTAQITVAAKCPADFSLGFLSKQSQKEKIRIGYYSADFHNHATTYLMAEMFEQHNREKFEIIAFSFGPTGNDQMRERISAEFDEFVEVGNQSDQDVACLSRNMRVDIAIDLKGFTTDSRAGIFAFRAAPIQVSFLGYPGTMAAEYMDYLIADKTVIPPHRRQHYTEKIVYLPHSYQVNDSKRQISDRVFSRLELGLPQTGVVFCCFNNNYKIMPGTFDSWMRILQKVDGSVLWLLEDNPLVPTNLRKEAVRRGVDGERLIFASRMPVAEHLSRHRAADLFLDTLPYNAHTTASDALWAGLPVLTCAGESFASRVAASLLTAVGMPELITTTQEEYEAVAVELATHPERLQSIRHKLERNRLITPLFNAKLFTKHIEAGYCAMVERYQADLSPEHITVDEEGLATSSLTGSDMPPALVELTLYEACPLCGSDSLVNHRTGDCSKHRCYKPALSASIQWVLCNSCSHIFRNGYYTDEALKLVFDESQDIQKVGNDIERQRMVSAKMIEKVLPYKSCGVWLDVGFGNGSLLFTAQEYGFHPIGLDLRTSNVEALGRFGIQAVCMDIKTAKLKTQCSVISMADVLEHMPHPVDGLKAAHGLLEDGGILFLSMPNFESTVWEVMDAQDVNPYWGEMEHCHNFSRARLYALLKDNGFEPLRYGISERYRVCMEVVARKV